MLVYLADLADTYSTKNESLMVPLNIGYIGSLSNSARTASEKQRTSI